MVQAAPEIQRFYVASAVRCLNAQRRHFDIVSKQMHYNTQLTSYTTTALNQIASRAVPGYERLL
jgi:hypothetical protein